MNIFILYIIYLYFSYMGFWLIFIEVNFAKNVIQKKQKTEENEKKEEISKKAAFQIDGNAETLQIDSSSTNN